MSLALLGALVAGSGGMVALMYNPATDGAVRANGGTDITTWVAGIIGAGGGLMTVISTIKAMWPKSAKFIDGGLQVAEWLQKNGFTPPDGLITPGPVKPVPTPAPAIELPPMIAALMQFVTSHGVEGELKFRLGGQVLTWKIEPGEDPAAPLQLVPAAMPGK